MNSITSRKLHALFSEMASGMNRKGISALVIGRSSKEKSHNIEMTGLLVKELLFRPAMHATTGYTSTAQLSDEGAEVLYRALNERMKKVFRVDTPFESAEEMTHMEEIY